MSLLNRAGPRPTLPGTQPRRPGFKPLVAVGTLLAALTLGGVLSKNAQAAFLYHGTLLVANRGAATPAILRIDTSTDTVIQTITQADVSNPNNVISDVQVDPVTGNIFVAVDLDGNNGNAGGTGEVVVFDPFGQYLRTVPLPDDGPGGPLLSYAPFGVDVDTDGSIWATRPNSLQIVRVANNATGTVLGQFDLSAAGALGPTDVRVSPSPGVVYVSDADPSGVNTGQLFEVDTAATPTTIIKRGDGSAVSPGGFESVELLNNSLVVSTTDGFLAQFDPTGTGSGTLLFPPFDFGDGVATLDTAYKAETGQLFASRSSGTVDVPFFGSYTGNGFAAGGPLVQPAGVAIAVDPASSLRYNLTPNIGNTFVGQSVSQTLTVTNESAAVVTVNGVFNASGSADFSVDADPATPFTLQPGSSAIFTIRFTPAVGETGTKSALLRVNSTDPVQPVRDFTIFGTILDPTIGTVPASTLSFGTVCINTSKTLPIDVTNLGSSPLTIGSITSSGAPVTIAGPATPISLLPGGHTTVQVTVTPTAAGAIPASSVTITSDSGGTPGTTTTITVTATGGASQIALSPTALAFGNVCLGDTKTLPINVLNNGACDLTLSGAAITPLGSPFTLQPVTTPLVIPHGGQTTLYVTLTPTATGAQSGTLTLTSDSGGVAGTTTTVGLTGSSPIGVLGSEPNNLAFGNVCQNVPVTKNVSLTNTGACDLSVISVSVFNTDYSVVSGFGLPLTLEPGNSVLIPVTLTATVGSGADNGTLTVITADASSVTIPLTATVVPQSIGFSPTSVSFGSVCKGATKSQTVTILNNGGCDLTVTDVAITAGGAVYSVKPVTLPLIIPRGGQAPVEVVFAPTAVGSSQIGTLTVTSNTGGTPGTTSNVALTGDAPAPIMSTSPTALAYGNVCRGVPVTKNLQILNTGKCDLTVTALALSGALPADYNVGSTLVLPVTLGAGSSVTVPVTLTPSVTSGADNATLTVSATDVPNITVALTANVAPQIIAASPTTLDFGKVCNGDSKTLPLNILNKGGCDLTVSSVSIPAGPFSVQPLTSSVIVPRGGQTTVLVTFAPTDGTFGSKSATLTVASDDPATPSFTTTVQGTVPAPDINVSPQSLSFSEVCQGMTSTLPLEIFNQGDCDLTISAISVAGTGFSASLPQLPIVLAKSDSVTVQVSYTGTLPFGSHTGTVTITSNDPDESSLVVPLTATVPSPGILIQGITSANTLDFGNVDINDVPAHTKEIELINTGSCPLHVTNVAFSAATTEFSVIEASPTVGSPLTIQSGQSVPFHVLYHPTSCPLKTATLNVTSDDASHTSIDITVTASTNCATPADLDGGNGIAFPPTVIQQYGKAFSERSPILTNKSLGTMRINSISIAGADKDGEYELLRVPPVYPLFVPAGGTVGGGNLTVRFHPYQVARSRRANLEIVVGDPISGADLGTVTVPLAGEGVRPGARLLVKKGGNPAAKVQRIELNQFLDGRRPLTLAAFTNVKPKIVSPGPPQADFVYHVEFGPEGTVGVPKALKPGRYRYVTFLQVGSKLVTKEKQFTIGTTTFVDGLVINY